MFGPPVIMVSERWFVVVFLGSSSKQLLSWILSVLLTLLKGITMSEQFH